MYSNQEVIEIQKGIESGAIDNFNQSENSEKCPIDFSRSFKENAIRSYSHSGTRNCKSRVLIIKQTFENFKMNSGNFAESHLIQFADRLITWNSQHLYTQNNFKNEKNLEYKFQNKKITVSIDQSKYTKPNIPQGLIEVIELFIKDDGNLKDYININEFSSIYAMSAQRMNTLLGDREIQSKKYRSNNSKDFYWVLNPPYRKEGYTKEIPVNNLINKQYSVWTLAGVIFLYTKLKEDNIIPVIEQGEQCRYQ